MNKILLRIILLAPATQNMPMHAMLARVARAAAIQSNLLNSGPQRAPTTLSRFDLADIPPRTALLTRTLAAQQNESAAENSEDQSKEYTYDSQSDQSGWKDFFYARFIPNKAATALGISLFGVHAWWTDGDICQTPQDFRDSKKLAHTKECFLGGGSDRIFNVFMRNFNNLKNDPIALDKVLEFFCTNFDDLKTEQSKIKEFTRIAANEHALLEKNPWGKKLLAKIAKETSFLQPAVSIEHCFLNASTQSAQHFKALRSANYDKMFFFSKPKNTLPKCLEQVVQTVLDIEKTEQEQGNYTFVHTCHWDVHFFQDIDAHLRAIAYGSAKQPLSLRPVKKPNPKKSNTYKAQRKRILSKDDYCSYIGESFQKNMIFMNAALFAGCNESFSHPYLSNALYFFLQNHSENKPKLTLDKIAKHLNMTAYLKRYAKEFEELKRLHAAASAYGAGIVFSFSPNMLKESVYIAYAGGAKRNVYIKQHGWTEDAQVVLDTLRTAPEKIIHLDKLEFVFVVTKDCGLNPRIQASEDLKIIPFNAADPKKITLYEQKRDKLMAKIKADVKAERAAWNKQKKLAHTKLEKEMNTWFARYCCLKDLKKPKSRLVE